MNLCVFTGRTTKDIEIRYAQDSMAIAKLTLAVDNGYGDNKKTSFFELTAFKGIAENMEKLVRKGQKIIVQCEAQQNTWKDRDGINRSSINFLVRSWEFAESKKADVPQANPSAYTKVDSDGFMDIPDDVDDMLPF